MAYVFVLYLVSLLQNNLWVNEFRIDWSTVNAISLAVAAPIAFIAEIADKLEYLPLAILAFLIAQTVITDGIERKASESTLLAGFVCIVAANVFNSENVGEALENGLVAVLALVMATILSVFISADSFALGLLAMATYSVSRFDGLLLGAVVASFAVAVYILVGIAVKRNLDFTIPMVPVVLSSAALVVAIQ